MIQNKPDTVLTEKQSPAINASPLTDYTKVLGDFVQTAIDSGADGLDSVISKFPELKEYDKSILGDFVETAISDGPENFSTTISKFPEFFPNNTKNQAKKTAESISGTDVDWNNIQPIQSEQIEQKNSPINQSVGGVDSLENTQLKDWEKLGVQAVRVRKDLEKEAERQANEFAKNNQLPEIRKQIEGLRRVNAESAKQSYNTRVIERQLHNAMDNLKMVEESQGGTNPIVQFGKSLGRGLAKIDEGFTDIYDNIAVVNPAIKRFEAVGGDISKLNQYDQTLLQSLAVRAVTDELAGAPTNGLFASQVGTSLAQTIPYMIEFALTKGLATGAQAATKEALKNGALALSKKAGINAGKALTKAGSAANWAVSGTAGAFAQSAAMPGTYGHIADNIVGQIVPTVDDKGQVQLAGRVGAKNAANAIGKGLTQGAISSVAERSGFIFDEVGKKILFSAPYKAAVSKLGKYGYDKAVKTMAQFRDTKFIKELMEKFTWDGVVGETGEEYIEAGLNQLLFDDDSSLSDMANPRALAQTALLSGIIGGTFMATSTGTRVYAKRSMDKADKRFSDIAASNGLDEETILSYKMQLSEAQSADEANEIASNMAIVLANTGVGDITTLSDAVNVVVAHAKPFVRYNAMIESTNDIIKRQIAEYHKRIGNVQHRETGDVIQVSTHDGQSGYVVSGDIDNDDVIYIVDDQGEAPIAVAANTVQVNSRRTDDDVISELQAKAEQVGRDMAETDEMTEKELIAEEMRRTPKGRSVIVDPATGQTGIVVDIETINQDGDTAVIELEDGKMVMMSTSELQFAQELDQNNELTEIVNQEQIPESGEFSVNMSSEAPKNEGEQAVRIEQNDSLQDQGIPQLDQIALIDKEIEDASVSLGMLEDQWNDRIQDYIYHNYPTQIFVSAQTMSKEGIEERKRMNSDDVLKSMRAQMDKELTEADDKITQLINKKNQLVAATTPVTSEVTPQPEAVTTDTSATEADIAAQSVDTEPTQAQKEAGNYKKGHVNVGGFDITIENPKGSERTGVDKKGNKWSVKMNNHYGYFKRTEGKDGDQIDVFLGDNPESEIVFVVDQVNEDGSFDESKVMLGFNSIEDARDAYMANYSDGWNGIGSITAINKSNFKQWLYDGKRQKKAFSEYTEVKNNVTTERHEVVYPRDKDGNIDYDKIDTPEMFASGLIEEFGADALSIIEDEISNFEKNAKKQESKGTTIQMARVKKSNNVRRRMLNDIRLLVEQNAKVEAEKEIQRQFEQKPIVQQGELNIDESQQDPTTDAEQSNVVDVTIDKAADARKRGFRMQDGNRIDRQGEVPGVIGSQTQTKFSNNQGDSVSTTFKVIEADDLQPSHVNGQRNLSFFIDEAQPKDRTDGASKYSAEQIARNINPAEITGGVTAYTGSPVTNSRGEVIQGNNRAEALNILYGLGGEQAAKYKQHLIDNYEQYGFSEQDVETIKSMNKPVLVRVANVTDDEAIRLGQKKASDVESGGIQRIDPKNILNQLSEEQLDRFLSILYSSDSEADESLMDVVRKNARAALRYLYETGAINETQLVSALDKTGRVNVDAADDLINISKQRLFKGGNDNIEAMFAALPEKAKKAILQTIHRDNGGVAKRLQEAIEAYYYLNQDAAFNSAGNIESALRAAISWARSYQMDFSTGQYVPLDRYSLLSIRMACLFRGDTQKNIISRLNGVYDAINGVGGDLFSAPVQLSKEEALDKFFGISNFDGLIDPNLLTQYKTLEDGKRKQQQQGELDESDDKTGERGGRVSGGLGQSGERDGAAEQSGDSRDGEEADGERVRAQSTESPFKRITKKAFGKLINKLKKTGLAKRIVTDKKEFDRKLNEVLGANKNVSESSTAYEKSKKYTTKAGKQLSFDFAENRAEEVSNSKGENSDNRTGSNGVQREGVPLTNRLDRLKEGEFSHVERIFTEKKHFDFTGSENIETVEDVVSIFDKLEDEAVENSFIVYVKDGRAVVQHLCIGGFYETMVNKPAIFEGIKRMNPDKVFFIHNHPSGILKASKPDVMIHDWLKMTFGDKIQDSIIINLRTGRYATYNESGAEIRNKSGNKKGEYPVKVFSFDKQVFDEGYDHESLEQVNSSDAIAKFISSHRLGNRDKISFLVLNNQNKVVGNFFTDETSIHDGNIDRLSDDLISRAISYGGRSVIVYGRLGNSPLTNSLIDKLEIKLEIKSGGGIQFLDIISIGDDGGMVNRWGSNVGVQFMTNEVGDVYGFVTSDGTIYLNPDNMNANTPIHEFAHLFLDTVQKNNPTLYNRGAELIKQTEYWDEVNNNPAYSGLSEDARINEALAMAIGDRGEMIVNGGIKEQMKSWIDSFIEAVKSLFGVSTDIPIDQLTIGEIIDKSAKTLLSGRRLTDGIATDMFSAEEVARMNVIKDEAQMNGSYMKAPNGKATNLTEQQWLQVRTPEFKAWFGDWENDPENASKVVDENGEPKVVYHGTTRDDEKRVWDERTKSYNTKHTQFTSFKRVVDGEKNSGFFFNSDIDNASGYGYNLYSCFLNIRNPFVINANGDNYSSINKDGDQKDTYGWADYSEKSGFDGTIFLNISDGVGYGDMAVNTNNYVTFKPTQIKSATDNTGEFDSTNPNIRSQARRRYFGGNSGYVGYSMSVRAAEAREEGRFPKSDFRKEYGITQNAMEALSSIGVIDGSEWHHTSSYGNKTTFYGWKEDAIVGDDGSMVDTDYNSIYQNSKKEVDLLALKYAKAQTFEEAKDALVGLADVFGVDVPFGVKEAVINKHKPERTNSEAVEMRDQFITKSQSNGVRFSRGGRNRYGFSKKGKGLAAAANESFNRELNKFGVRLKTEVVDAALPILKLQQEVEKLFGKKLSDLNNAYTYNFSRASRALARMEVFEDEYMKDIQKAVAKLMKRNKDLTYEDIITYIQVKSGLERNEVFGQRDFSLHEEDVRSKASAAIAKIEEVMAINISKDDPEYEEEINKIRASKGYVKAVDTINAAIESDINKFKPKDYAALKTIAETIGKDVSELGDYVNDFEENNDVFYIWESIKNATAYNLKLAFDYGQVSLEFVEQCDNLQYYVPFKGWREDEASDIFAYENDGKGEGSIFSKAKGRTTQADDPLLNIGNDFQRIIHSGERNEMKKRLYYMAVNHPCSLYSTSGVWYQQIVNPDGSKEYVERAAEYDSDQAKYEENIRAFEQEMALLQDAGLAYKNKGRLQIGVPIKPIEESQHQVTVLINGEKRIIRFNTDPMLVRAINGTKKDEKQFLNWLRKGKDIISKNQTSRSPSFMLMNATRDFQQANAVLLIKEGVKHAAKFNVNYWTVLGRFAVTGEKKKQIEKYSNEFIDNGGPTGYATYHEYEKRRKALIKGIKIEEGSLVEKMKVKAANAFDVFTIPSQWLENAPRLATYITSREAGRSIQQSILDAKEVTLNFDRRGAGESAIIKYAQAAIGFFNPSIQAWNQKMALYKISPLKAGSIDAVHFAIGVMNAGLAYEAATHVGSSVLAALGVGGDDDDYLEYVPEYIKRKCVVIPIGNGQSITIPLSQEGAIATSLGYAFQKYVQGEYDEGDLALGLIDVASDILPVDISRSFTIKSNNVSGGQKLLHVLSGVFPMVFAPVFDEMANIDFTGSPIYKDTTSNRDDPEYLTAYKNTPELFVNLSKWVNDVSGGDYARKGVLDSEATNPDIMEHFLYAYFGGAVRDGVRAYKFGKALNDGSEFESKDIPFLAGRFYKPTERSKEFAVGNKFYPIKNEYDKLKKEYKRREDALEKGEISESDFEKYMNTDRFKKYIGLDDLMNDYNSIYKDVNDDENNPELKKALEDQKKLIIEASK